jgi:hypothetical protein
VFQGSFAALDFEELGEFHRRKSGEFYRIVFFQSKYVFLLSKEMAKDKKETEPSCVFMRTAW